MLQNKNLKKKIIPTFYSKDRLELRNPLIFLRKSKQ